MTPDRVAWLVEKWRPRIRALASKEAHYYAVDADALYEEGISGLRDALDRHEGRADLPNSHVYNIAWGAMRHFAREQLGARREPAGPSCDEIRPQLAG